MWLYARLQLTARCHSKTAGFRNLVLTAPHVTAAASLASSAFAFPVLLTPPIFAAAATFLSAHEPIEPLSTTGRVPPRRRSPPPPPAPIPSSAAAALPTTTAAPMRLARWLARSAACASRRSAEIAILSGRVGVNGALVTDCARDVHPAADTVTLDSSPIPPPRPLEVIATDIKRLEGEILELLKEVTA